MSQVFVICSLQAKTSSFDTALTQALTLSRVKPEHLEAIYWAGKLPKINLSLPVIQLAGSRLAPLAAIQAASQAILAEDVQLALAGAVGMGVLLAAPQAVGRWNLFPQAAINGRGSSAAVNALEQACHKALHVAETPWEAVQVVILPPGSIFPELPKSAMQITSERTGIRPFLQLISALKRKKRSVGLLVQTDSIGQAAALLVERV